MNRSPASGTDLWSYATLCIVILFWSGNFIVGRAVNGVIPPFTLALVRWSGALVILLPFAWRHLRADRQRLLSHWKAVLLLGLTGVAAFNAFIYSGLQFTTASKGLLLQAGDPRPHSPVQSHLFRRPNIGFADRRRDSLHAGRGGREQQELGALDLAMKDEAVRPCAGRIEERRAEMLDT
ncbi:DMT family transporter [Altericroceibacterium spongiae]|uniref:DMT family transporter n=1 Tax=Altericroceibacterium spongiae TaxID=2320269 RepID=UPI001EE5BBE6|nr:DMT family transporter [Altericroceibacterium spongiae]